MDSGQHCFGYIQPLQETFVQHCSQGTGLASVSIDLERLTLLAAQFFLQDSGIIHK